MFSGRRGAVPYDLLKQEIISVEFFARLINTVKKENEAVATRCDCLVLYKFNLSSCVNLVNFSVFYPFTDKTQKIRRGCTAYSPLKGRRATSLALLIALARSL